MSKNKHAKTAVAAPEAHGINAKTIFGWLALLTGFEIVVAYLPLSRTAIATLLIVSSLAKAALVALFFMHLRFEKLLVNLMVIFTTLLAIIFVLGLFPDIVLSAIRFTN